VEFQPWEVVKFPHRYMSPASHRRGSVTTDSASVSASSSSSSSSSASGSTPSALFIKNKRNSFYSSGNSTEQNQQQQQQQQKKYSVSVQIVRSLDQWSGSHRLDRSIYMAYLQAIDSAQRFIYLETGQLISSNAGGSFFNRIVDAIIWKISQAIETQQTFRVIMVVSHPCVEEAFNANTGVVSHVAQNQPMQHQQQQTHHQHHRNHHHRNENMGKDKLSHLDKAHMVCEFFSY
jgi:hypothetical protein